MKTVVCTVGCRPDAIKMMPLIKELKQRENFRTVVLSTGQHREMLGQVLDAFHIRADCDLHIMKERQTLFDVTEGILCRIRGVLERVGPDAVLVHGDTSTAFASALACFYMGIPVGHVEAGLRTYNIRSPYPEEFNRQAVGLIAAYHFAPTRLAKENLLREGKDPESIWVTGNTVTDAMRHTVSEGYTHPILDWVGDSRMLFLTAHRRENVGPPMRRMFRAVRRVLAEHPDVKAVYPIHMNPAVRRIADEEFGGCRQICRTGPMNAVDCHNFEARCYLCLTDSGGVQEECPSYGKPVLVMRDTTERPEGIAAGAIRLVGTEEERIYRECTTLLDDREAYAKMSRVCNPFGDGQASRRIADVLTYGRCDEFLAPGEGAFSDSGAAV